MKRSLLLLLIVTACRSKPRDNIYINVDHTRQIVSIMGLSSITLNGMQHDSIDLQAWQNLFPVMTMPADTDMRELASPIKGTYKVTGHFIIFTPDTLFKTGQTYFARYYRYDQPIGIWDLALQSRLYRIDF